MKPTNPNDAEPPAPEGTGHHMIEPLRTLAGYFRSSPKDSDAPKSGDYLAEVLEIAAQGIENEKRRADRAEWRLARMGGNVGSKQEDV